MDAQPKIAGCTPALEWKRVVCRTPLGPTWAWAAGCVEHGIPKVVSDAHPLFPQLRTGRGRQTLTTVALKLLRALDSTGKAETETETATLYHMV